MKKEILISLFFIFLFTFDASPAYAHRLVIEPLEPGTIRAVYEDGSFSTRTLITVYDATGNEIDHGSLDSDGYFYFDETEAHFFVADDGIGHRTEWTVGEEVVFKSDPHRWMIGGIVLFLSISIAVYFSYRVRKRKQLAKT
ncbi:hypothetical protein [Shouchella shacheensis]|uniref:hypothetical protein n=1 Tax=Shouchella shacheensis TaxID=1649580 RepID=UPI0007403ED7|nr:hypothetical protein [Shouchella shacheensis]